MKKILAALFICAALVSGSVSAHGWHNGGWSHRSYYGYHNEYRGGWHRHSGWVVGAIVGTIVGAELAQPRYYPEQPPVQYYPATPPTYVQRVPVYCVNYYGQSYVCAWRYVQEYQPQY